MAKRVSRAKAEKRPGSDTPVEVTSPPSGEASDRQAVSSYTEDDVRRRAYELYLARNSDGSDALTDWLDAERELRDLSGN